MVDGAGKGLMGWGERRERRLHGSVVLGDVEARWGSTVMRFAEFRVDCTCALAARRIAIARRSLLMTSRVLVGAAA
jgi:hypothetical protein